MSTDQTTPPPRKDYEKLEVASEHVESVVPQPAATPMIEVVAPSTLPEGYKFDAQVDNNNTVSIEVPKGGVEEGQRFMVPVPGTGQAANTQPRSSIPVGEWKDGCCDCFVHGICHPQICLTIWCPLFALGQVMTRMSLNWYGMPATVAEASSTFKKVVFVVIGRTFLYMIIEMFAFISLKLYEDYEYYEYGHYAMGGVQLTIAFIRFFDWAVWVAFVMYAVAAVMNTRRFIRQKYAIPEKDCKGCEDCCCSFWCFGCAISQMARHTADYDTYAAACCTDNGLPDGVPSPVHHV